jgi:hypothetical protein
MNTAPIAPKPMPPHLLEELTNHFSPDRKLGGGTYGDVYLVRFKFSTGIVNGTLHTWSPPAEHLCQTFTTQEDIGWCIFKHDYICTIVCYIYMLHMLLKLEN